MRQVPIYTIIGDGRVASHFCHYLKLQNIPYQQWSRRLDPHQLHVQSMCRPAERILILINDSAIETFIQQHDFLKNKLCIHFSGALTTPLAYGTHPLMTFGRDYYELALYKGIPFILEQNGPEFSDLLPGLSNPYYRIPSSAKNFYHSLCVLSGNFTCLLWHKFFSELEHTFAIPKEVAYPYLQQIMRNIMQDAQAALTGPLSRNDQKTIHANLDALANDPFGKIYQAFVELYRAKS